MNTDTPAPPPATDIALRRNAAVSIRIVIALIGAALVLQSVLRLWLAVSLLLKSSIDVQFGALVHWRVLDQYTGWIGVLILAMADEGGRRGRILWRSLLGLGLAGIAATLLWGDASGRAAVEIAVGCVLALGTAVVVVRQIVALMKAAGPAGAGLNIEQVWRGVTIQWALLWIAAEVVLRIKLRRDGVESEPGARTILFILPVIAFLPNVMMAMGIRWWGMIRAADVPRARVRAWLVALTALNLGAVCMVGSVWYGWLGILGASLMIVGVGMYLVGFPKDTWRIGGKVLPAAFGILVIGLAMMAVERLMAAGGQIVPSLYSSSWRHLLASAETLWLIGMGGMALRHLVAPHVRAGTHGPAMGSGLLVLLGILATAGLFLLAINQRDLLQGLFVGAALQFLGVLIGAAAALRASGPGRA